MPEIVATIAIASLGAPPGGAASAAERRTQR